MSRSVRSRIRLFIGALGCTVLVTSLISWAYTLHAAAGRYTWVRLDPLSRASAAETGELWHVSASCVRPYFVKALFRSKAKLEAHYNAAPDEVRARLNPRGYPGQSIKPAAWHPVENGDQGKTGRSNPYGEYAAALQVKYAEWYAALFKLEIEAGNWQQRLIDVGDQTVVLSAASRASFAAYAHGAGKLRGLQDEFDDQILTTLGLGGLSSDEQLSLKSACVTIKPVMARLGELHYLGALWHWPIDCLAEFSFGLELVLISIFFGPIALWLGTGDVDVNRSFLAPTYHLGTSMRDFAKSQFVGVVRCYVRQTNAAIRATLDRLKSYAASRRTRRSIARIAEPQRRDGRPATAPIGPAPTMAIKAAIRHD
jgi:hypothetical protein